MQFWKRHLRQKTKNHHISKYILCRNLALIFVEVKLITIQTINDIIDSIQNFDSSIKNCIYIGSIETNGISTLKNYPNDFKFDLIIYDYTAGPCFLPFVHKFGNPPLIGVTAYSYPSYTNSFMGGHHYYSYVPHNSMPSDENMNFGQRLYNFFLHVGEDMWVRWNFNWNQF